MHCVSMPGTPIHVQLRKALLLECASGNFEAGQRFFSHRAVGKLWKVSNTTVKSSLDWLLRQEIIETRPRSGYYLAHHSKRRARLLLHKQQPDSHLPPPSSFETRRFQYLADSSKATRRLALVIYGEETGGNTMPGVDNPALKSVWSRSFFEETVSLGWEFECFLNDGNPEQQERISRWIRERRVDGVAIFMRTWEEPLRPMVQGLLKANIPVVRVFGDSEKTGAPMLNLNNVGMGYEAAGHFLRAGHRKIAALIEPQRCRDFTERVEGCRYALQEAGLGENALRVFRCRDGRPVTRKLRQVLEDPKRRPTALFATRIELLRSVEPVLKELGLRVPEDVSVIACGGVNHVAGMEKPVDVFRIDFCAVGRKALRMLEDLMVGRLQEKFQFLEVPYDKQGSVAPADVSPGGGNRKRVDQRIGSSR